MLWGIFLCYQTQRCCETAGVVNNTAPVKLGTTELTTTATEYRGTTTMRMVLPRLRSPVPTAPCKTPLSRASRVLPQASETAVIFTVLTSPDVPQATMWVICPIR